MASRPNHRQIAEAAGVSTATVSRALAGHPHVREAVRERVFRQARRLGYQADPRLAYLSRLRWSSGRTADTVDRYTGADLKAPKFQRLGATACELGYELEFHHVEAMRSQASSLSRQFASRGIVGILFNLHVNDPLPDLRFEQFSVVFIGEEYPAMPFYRVGTDWRQGFDELGSKLRETGRSIGFCLLRFSGEERSAGVELNRIILAEALLQREEIAAAGLGDAPLFRFDEDDPSAPVHFARWIDQNGIDVCVCNHLTPVRWLREGVCSVGTEPRFFLIPRSQQADLFNIAGADPNLGERLSQALRGLHNNLLLDKRGFSELPTKTLVPMVWKDLP